MLNKNQNFEDLKQQISMLGIYELRGLARACGIKSPTTKLRSELVEEVIAALSTGDFFQPQQIRKGRPVKQLVNLGGILESIIALNEPSSSAVVFNQNVVDQPSKNAGVERMMGVLRIDKESSYLVDLKTHNNVYVGGNLIQKHGLIAGDLLQIEAVKLAQINTFSAIKILSINNTNADGFKREKHQGFTQALPSKFLHLEYGEVLLGGRNYILTSSPLFMNNQLKQLISALSKQNAQNIFIGLNLSYEDRAFIFGCQNIIAFTTSYLDSPQSARTIVQDAYSVAVNMHNSGKNVNVIIYDAATVISVLNQDARLNENNHLFKQIFSLASAYENDLTLTVVATCDECDKQEGIIKQDVIKISYNIKSK